MKNPSITLVVNTYESPLALAKVLAALAWQRVPATEIIIADDGSGESTKEVIEQATQQFNFPIRHCRQENQGFRRAVILNKAIAMAKGHYLVFLDGDCVPECEFVADHIALAEKGYWVQGRRAFVEQSSVEKFVPTTRCVWSFALAGKLTGIPKALRLPFPIVKRGKQQRGILGCNLGIWREDLVAVNGYDETFVGWGREDADLANRLYHLGRPRKFVYGRAILYHLNHSVALRSRLGENQCLLDQTIAEKRIRSVKGLDQYLTRS